LVDKKKGGTNQVTFQKGARMIFCYCIKKKEEKRKGGDPSVVPGGRKKRSHPRKGKNGEKGRRKSLPAKGKRFFPIKRRKILTLEKKGNRTRKSGGVQNQEGGFKGKGRHDQKLKEPRLCNLKL